MDKAPRRRWLWRMADFLVPAAIALDQAHVPRRERVQNLDMLVVLGLARDDDVPERDAGALFLPAVPHEMKKPGLALVGSLEGPDLVGSLQRGLDVALVARELLERDVVGL